MKTDLELETWRQEWRDRTEPLPELKKKIRRQNLRTAAAAIAICLCLAVSSTEAWLHRSWFMAGMAAGIAFAGVFVGGFAWWVRRGAWKPTAQTTLAYAELSYKRAVAKARTLRFSFHLLLAMIVLFAGFTAWHWHDFHLRERMILGAIVIELFFLKHLERRKKREIVETKKLVDDLKE